MNDLARVSLGLLPTFFPTKQLQSWVWDEGEAAYRGNFRTTGQSWTLWVDGGSGTLKKVRWLAGKSTIEVDYSEPDPCCEGTPEIQLAYRVQITKSAIGATSKMQAQLVLEWDSLAAKNLEADVFKFRPEKEVEIEELN